MHFRHRTLVTVLGVAVSVFCLHNVYQSSIPLFTQVSLRDEHINDPFHRAAATTAGEGLLGRLFGGGQTSPPPAARRHHPDHVPLRWPPGQGRPPHLPPQMQKQEALNYQLKGGSSDSDGKHVDPMEQMHPERFFARERAPGPIYSIENMTWPKLDNFSHKMMSTIPGGKVTLPDWQRRLRERGQLGQPPGEHFYLAELLQVRVYTNDKAKWTIRELKQWIHFMFLSGVEHIYLCDHFKYEFERLDEPLQVYIDLGLITYFPWSTIRHAMNAQIKCYQHMIDHFKYQSTWQVAVDMDEYPYIPQDTSQGFLTRYLRNVTLRHGVKVAEISMNNFLMLGQGDRTRQTVIDRINRMTPKPANILVKPIYRPEMVKANIHHNILMQGVHMDAHGDDLKMLHYWGARVQDWGPDTAKTLSITTEMNDMRDHWAHQVTNSLLAFGELDSFSSTTGP